MPYHLAICDDSPEDRTLLQGLVQGWAAEMGLDLRVELYSSAERFLFHSGEFRPDILLLDIEMGQMDGVTMAKRVRRDNETVQIIFVTGYSDYLAEGYEVAALHYLMKPVNPEKLRSVLNRAVERLWKDERTLNLDFGDAVERIPMHRIRYLDVCQNYVTVHAHEDFTVKRPLGEFEALLDDRFYRVSRSAIVNLRLVQRVTRQELRLTDGSAIPLPRGAYERVNRAIIAHT